MTDLLNKKADVDTLDTWYDISQLNFYVSEMGEITVLFKGPLYAIDSELTTVEEVYNEAVEMLDDMFNDLSAEVISRLSN